MRLRAGALLLVGLLPAMASPARACTAPPPPVYNGGSLAEHRALAKRLASEYLQRQLWRNQVDLFDKAKRVSLARVIASEKIALGNDPLGGYRLTLEPIEVYKGAAVDGQPRTVEDKGVSSCGLYGGGSGTSQRSGEYLILYEDVPALGGGPHTTLLVSELRDPRILDFYGKGLASK
ncbi:hypothetical protein GCM10022280_13050 [Sphingomonas swuensis]|uniref:Uncharacterized protein n=1 Tax=Sphingomonas swuensis TaxID=977800 RepID=A0ABP7SRU0_9SPHN